MCLQLFTVLLHLFQLGQVLLRDSVELLLQLVTLRFSCLSLVALFREVTKHCTLRATSIRILLLALRVRI